MFNRACDKTNIKKFIPSGRYRAEGDNVVRGCTCEGTGAVIVSITVGVWARILKELRVRAGFTRGRSCVGPTATVLWVPKSLARALTRHAPVAAAGAQNFELRGTSGVQISYATSCGAVPFGSALGHNRHREVITVDEADVIVVKTVIAA